jgi:hypothetical protein
MKRVGANRIASNTRFRVASTAVALALVAILAACSTSDVVPPGLVGGDSASAGTSLAEELSPPDTTIAEGDAAGPTPGDGRQFALAANAPRVQFAPVVGAAPQAIAPLTQRVLQRAAERGIATAGADGGAAYVVKGYLSTLPEGGGTTLVYVWDVFDLNGTRVHRIQGNEAVLGSSGVEAAMRAIADRTVDDLARWLARRSA